MFRIQLAVSLGLVQLKAQVLSGTGMCLRPDPQWPPDFPFVCPSCDYSIIISTSHYLLWIQWFYKTLIFASPSFSITFRNILGCLRLAKYTHCTVRHLFSISRTASNEYQQPVRGLAGYRSWGRKESDMTEWARTHTTSYHDKSKSLKSGGTLTPCRPWSSSC